MNKVKYLNFRNRRIPGYSGFLPASALNDRGTVRPHCFTTQGENFHWESLLYDDIIKASKMIDISY